MAYTSNKKINQLETKSTADQTDLHVLGDTSDNGRAKSITEENLEDTFIGSTNFTNQLANSIPFITDLTSNTTFQALVNAFIPTSSGGGGGGLSRLTQTFLFSDFANVGGDGIATFTDSLPADAVPVGVVYDITSAFDFGSNSIVVQETNGGSIIGAPVASNTIAILTGETDGQSTSFDFTTNPNPIVKGNTVPTQGSVTVTILYSTSETSTVISTYTSKPVALIGGGTSTPTDLSSNTVMSIGLLNIPQQIIVTKLSVYVGSLASAGTFTIAIYSEDGQTRLLNATSGTISAGGAVASISISALTLPAGNYYVGVHSNGSASMGLRSVVLDNLNITPSGGNVLAGLVTITASTSPTTINPVSDITFNLYSVALIRFDA